MDLHPPGIRAFRVKSFPRCPLSGRAQKDAIECLRVKHGMMLLPNPLPGFSQAREQQPARSMQESLLGQGG